VILDTSAVIAILNEEPIFEKVEARILLAASVRIGTPTLLETSMVAIGRLAANGKELVDRFLRERNVRTIDFTADHAARAGDAFERYGKGRHPAGLNMGDCFSYATASIAGEPLLFVGDDFSKTDLVVVDLDLDVEES
jgi:ribonuclease VapC